MRRLWVLISLAGENRRFSAAMNEVISYPDLPRPREREISLFSVKNRVRSGYEIMNEEKRLLQDIISLSNNFLGYERYIFGSL